MWERWEIDTECQSEKPKGLRQLGRDTGGRIIVNWILDKWDNAIVNCIHLAKNRNQLQVDVKTVMNL